jgi:hypothetical protein
MSTLPDRYSFLSERLINVNDTASQLLNHPLIASFNY